MFNKITLLIITGIGISAGVNMLDQRINKPDIEIAETRNNPWSAPSRNNRRHVAAISADRNGQFTAAALVNGVHVEMLADTGATLVVLTEEDAERIGIDLEWLNFDTPVQTANGITMTASTVLDEVSIGGIKVRNVNALVTRSGQLKHSLLGMSYLGKLTKFEIRGDQLVLHD